MKETMGSNLRKIEIKRVEIDPVVRPTSKQQTSQNRVVVCTFGPQTVQKLKLVKPG